MYYNEQSISFWKIVIFRKVNLKVQYIKMNHKVSSRHIFTYLIYRAFIIISSSHFEISILTPLSVQIALTSFNRFSLEAFEKSLL